ncbi:MAG TPA: hypothetical protein VFG65_00870 [Fimbriimonadales bacterium]|jgi:hypothetical protein|nr:hypothetical protein [Fimbriimonadales bacterium]
MKTLRCVALIAVAGMVAGFAPMRWDRAAGVGVVDGGSWAGSHFDFVIRLPQARTERNRFHFWDPGMFLPVDVQLTHIRGITFTDSRVDFAGSGTNNGDPITASGWVQDNGDGSLDHFHFVAHDLQGNVVAYGDGHLTEGDIVVTHGQ